ncbi:hypothetical protein Mapa_013861 [Marchantia paleacea]|nr:hypothetical protein Mapa_013861 [Marchantia paleacea]
MKLGSTPSRSTNFSAPSPPLPLAACLSACVRACAAAKLHNKANSSRARIPIHSAVTRLFTATNPQGVRRNEAAGAGGLQKSN